MFRWLIAILALGLAIPAATVSPVGAEGEGPILLGIAPIGFNNSAFFELTLQPGDSRELKVEVGNYGPDVISARTYAADVYTIPNGGFGARLDGEATSGTTEWLDYPAATVELSPGKALQQTFTVRVPLDARPGEYITSLVVQNEKPIPSSQGGIVVNQVQRKAIAVAITIPGPRLPALIVEGFEHQLVSGHSVISAVVSNTGNVRLKPTVEFLLVDEHRREVTRLDFSMDSFYAGTSTKVELPFDAALLAGTYRVSVRLDYEGGSASSGPVSLEVKKEKVAPVVTAPGSQAAHVEQAAPSEEAPSWPVFALAGGLVIVLALLLVGRAAWFRRRRLVARAAPATERNAGRPDRDRS